MQISNNYQPSFKSIFITKNANEIMSKRMASGEFIALQDKIIKKFKDSKFTVKLDTTSENSNRLDAMISYNIGRPDKSKGEFFEYVEEGTFSSIFRSPAKFVKKVLDIYNKKAVPFMNNGFKHVE